MSCSIPPCHNAGMEDITICWIGETPTDSWGQLAAFTKDGSIVGQATYKRWEQKPELTYLSGFFVDNEYRKHGIASDMMHKIFERLGRNRPYMVNLSGNLDRLFMETIAAEEDAPKLFEMLDDRSYKPMN
ncbi:GNAT family N-acetyltransferase [Paeniglutamicibacter cryotolerans]|nr:GNAT family N-acetyltransferase [Paeniglutamicibacter cryotolerans]